MKNMQDILRRQEEIIDILSPYWLIMPKAKQFVQNEVEMLAFYAETLSVLSLEDIKAAMTKCALSMTFFPSVAEIYAQAESARRYREGTTIPDADEAWYEVMAWIKSREKNDFIHDEVAEAVKNFGRKELLRLEESRIDVVRSQFMKIYEAVVKRREEQRLNEAVAAVLSSPNVKELPQDAKRPLKLVSGKS